MVQILNLKGNVMKLNKNHEQIKSLLCSSGEYIALCDCLNSQNTEAVLQAVLVGAGRRGEDGTILLALPLPRPVTLSVLVFKQTKPPPEHLAPKTLCKQLMNFQSTLF